MKVYRLELIAYSTRYGDLQEKHSIYSDVYSTLKRAFEEGKSKLKTMMNNIYEASDYCTKENSLSLEDMINDENIYYIFKITEVDPVYADNFTQWYSEKECILNHKPTHIIYYYDYQGNLEYKQLQWTLGGEHESGSIILRYPGDDDKNAGEKFQMGDFVQIKNKKEIYVVYGTPKKENGKLVTENKYYLSTIIDNQLQPYYEEYEYNLNKYEGTINKDSPYMLLKKLYKSDSKKSVELLEKLEKGEIILNKKPSFRDISEIME